jgi:PhzF family phenazine biosynthesis protein
VSEPRTGSGLSFDIVDVFTEVAGKGNPVAVIHDADGLSEERMQDAASWLGLPETVFVTRTPDQLADYAVRIFAPLLELPFAGHPSIGAAASVRSRNPALARKAALLQHCPAGLVTMRIDHLGSGETIFFVTPKPAACRSLDPAELKEASRAVGVNDAPQAGYLSDAGARWIVLLYHEPLALSAAKPDQKLVLDASIRLSASGITLIGPSPDADCLHELRSFAPAIGVAEDAVCGGGNASAAAALHVHQGGSLNYVASQGRHLGRSGRVLVSGPEGDQRFAIGGKCVVAASGTISL